MNEMNEPLRLLRKRGHWALEVTKLVAIDRDVLRPERRRVSGTDSVVRHLRERCAPSLVREALDLIVGEDDGTDRSFELEGEHWIQLEEEALGDSSSNANVMDMIKELRVELTTMRALHEAMRARLSLVERRSLQIPAADYGRAGARNAPRREQPGASLRPGARSRSALPGSEVSAASELGLAHTAASAPPVATPESAAAPQTSLSAGGPEPAAPAAKPCLLMPSHADIAGCLKQLLGADSELRAEKGALPKDLDAFYVSRVVDAADHEVGAILLDVAAGVELGGRLLGFPLAAIAEQAKSEPSTDILDAMNEVANNLGGFINRANPELRVRVRPLEKFSGVELGWLPQNTARAGNATKTGGRLWLAAR